jgi:SecD/SecF fusion protein
MNRNNFWRFVLVLLVVLWSVYELYPPTSKPLVQEFREKAKRTADDTTFSNILHQAQLLQKQAPERAYENLTTAIGTNDITKYFPQFDAKDEARPTTFILNQLQRQAAGKIRLGLDLQGGSSFLVEMDTTSLTNQNESSAALSQAVEVLRKRVDNLGVAEPVIQPQGNDRILIQLPGLSAAALEEAQTNIQRAAFLTFHLVNPHSDQDVKDNTPEPGYTILKRKYMRNGKEEVEAVEITKRPVMTGSGIKQAMPVRGNLGEPQIDFVLNDEGAKRFGDITSEHVGERLAIVLDGQLQSAPVIQSAIVGGRGQITGHFDDEEARSLASALENPLRAPVHIIQSSEVDPTLGKDSIRSGIKACIIGTLAVSAFMLGYYLFAGMVANVALLCNIIILIGVMCAFGTTFTLPGICGIVLTVGMAVDANVLIYERIREENSKGKSLRGAIAAGYSRAFSTIFDSHVTTLISSIILWKLGTGSIRGFGVALTIGVAASLFTALVVTRMIFDFLVDRGWIQSIKMFHLIPSHLNLDFMKLAKPAFITSWLLIILGCSYGLYRGKSALGVDFMGGDTTVLSYKVKESESAVRSALAKAGVKDPVIQYQKDPDPTSGKPETLRVVTAAKEGDLVKQALTQNFPQAQFQVVSQDHVGPTVGKEIQKSALIASLLSLFGILVYVAFRYEFSFAVGAVAAVVHDVLMTIGWYCLSGREFDATTVAAILTIIGFSTNDTIVIFDRIREDLKLGVRGTFRELMNQALNQTLSRTIITSGTVFLATLSLYIFGGGAINAFAFTFLVGIITGTYSSIYIASALVLWWHKGQRPTIGTGPVQAETVATAKQ